MERISAIAITGVDKWMPMMIISSSLGQPNVFKMRRRSTALNQPINWAREGWIEIYVSKPPPAPPQVKAGAYLGFIASAKW